MDTLSLGQKQDGLVIRKARKPHRCSHFTLRPDLPNDRMGHTAREWCETPISPGDRYLEYLGESAAFQSGHAYCTEHALEEWKVALA